MNTEQPDLIPDLPPAKRILVTDALILSTVQRIEGLIMAKEAIKATKSQLPGLRFALSAVDCEMHKLRSGILSRLSMLAAKSGANMNKMVVAGIENGTDKDGNDALFCVLETFDEMELNCKK